MEFFLDNWIFVLFVLYFLWSAFTRVAGSGERRNRRRPAPSPGSRPEGRSPWMGPWAEPDPKPKVDRTPVNKNPDYQWEAAETEKPAENRKKQQPFQDHPLPKPPVTMTNAVDLRISRFTRSDWKKAIVMKEILDPPRARRPFRRYFR